MYSVLLYRMKSNIYKQLLKWDSEGGGTLRSGVPPPPHLWEIQQLYIQLMRDLFAYSKKIY